MVFRGSNAILYFYNSNDIGIVSGNRNLKSLIFDFCHKIIVPA